MALFVNQKDDRSELQRRLAAELNEKARQKAKLDETERPDGITDSNYLRNTNSTTSLAWVWVVIIIAILVLIVWLMAALS